VVVWDGSRGPRMHLCDGPGGSRVRGRLLARLRGYADHPGSRRDILDDEKRNRE